MIELTCHCRNIQLVMSFLPPDVTACNCSLCRRYAAYWAYFQPEQVTISYHREPKVYAWNERMIEFNFCPGCGCVTHYQTTDRAPQQKIGVNFRMATLAELEDLTVRHFDGASSWQYLKD